MMAAHVSGTVWPQGVTSPRPVITTRRFKAYCSSRERRPARADDRGGRAPAAAPRQRGRRLKGAPPGTAARRLLVLRLVLVYVAVGVADALNLLGVLVGNLD